jgi:NAD(P)H dehydrogenase (quinone)
VGLIAVTGASGAVGGRVAARLAEAGAPRRLIVRDAGPAPVDPGAEVRVASGYGAGDEMQAALEGAETLLLIPAAEALDRVAQHATAVDAAVAAGVQRIVYLSFFRAAPDATFTFARDHFATERHIRAGALPWTFVRMNLYMDFVPGMVGRDGFIRGPAGDGRVSAILRDDVAAALAAVLTTGGHERRSYDVTGRASFTLAEAAAAMTAATGKRIRFQDETDEEAFDSRADFGADEWEVRGWVSSYQAVRDGSLAPVSRDVVELTGHEPGTLDEFLHAHPEALDHVAG